MATCIKNIAKRGFWWNKDIAENQKKKKLDKVQNIFKIVKSVVSKAKLDS